MRKSLLSISFTFSLLLSLLTGCGDNVVQVNPLVESFTDGFISRTGSVVVTLTKEMSQETLNKPAEDYISISPAVVSMEAIWRDSKTLVLAQKGKLGIDETYTVKVKTSKLDSEIDDDFEFTVKTLPLSISKQSESMSVNDDGSFNFDIVLVTPDITEENEIWNNVNISADINKSHSSADNKRTHTLSLKDIKAGTPDITISTKNATICTLSVPKHDTFEVLSYKYISGTEKCLEVTLTNNLDTKQSLKGLVSIKEQYAGNDASVRIDIYEGNRLRIYPTLNKQGRQSLSVIIDSSLKNKKGEKLGKDYKFTIDIDSELPNVDFIGNGVIVPFTESVVVPFKATGVRGVVCEVLKLYADNMSFFLADYSMNESYGFSSVARHIAYKTINLEQQGRDLSTWNTYGIDLSDLIKVEPGALYSIRLHIVPELSEYEIDGVQKMSVTEYSANDGLRLRELQENDDNSCYLSSMNFGWAYYDEENDEWYHSYDCQDASKKIYYTDRYATRNVIASNIGLTSYTNGEGKLIVVANDLNTSSPMKGVEIIGYNKQHRIVAKATTNGNGTASMESTEGEGNIRIVVAKSGESASYLKTDDYSSLSTSLFEVDGAVVQKGIKGFIYGERGVWRPGDTLHIAFMMSDIEKRLPENHPVTLHLQNPSGQTVYEKTVSSKDRQGSAAGLFLFHIPTDVEAPTGLWDVNINVGGTSFSKNLRIETVKPNRLKIDFSLPSVIHLSDNRDINIHTEWLTGATSSNLKYKVSADYKEVSTKFNDYKDYTFDVKAGSETDQDNTIAQGTTDNDGDAVVIIPMPSTNGQKSGSILATYTTTVYEPSGETSIDVSQATLLNYKSYVGVKAPKPADNYTYLATGKKHTFNVVSLLDNGTVAPKKRIEIKVYKTEWSWWWYSSGDIAQYANNSYHTPISKMYLNTDGSGKATFDLELSDNEWGRYIITATDAESHHQSAIQAYFDWEYLGAPRDSNGGSSATTLFFNTNKKSYEPGDNIVVSFPSSVGAHAIITIMNGAKVIDIKCVECNGSRTETSFEATEDMMPNSYIGISLIQPHGATLNDNPIRKYGIVNVDVSSDMTRLTPEIDMDDEIEPMQEFTIKVKEKKGKSMTYTLAYVDEGLLDLTHFKTPEPWPSFYAKEALGVRMWDIYDYVVGAFGGTIEQMFSIGGDGFVNPNSSTNLNRFTPVVYCEGPFELAAGKTATHKRRMPNYTGRIRTMVVATDGGVAFGQAEKSTKVLKSVMILATMPRNISPKDEIDLPVTVFSMKDNVGDIKVTLSTGNELEIVGNASKTIQSRKSGDQTITFRVKLKDNVSANVNKVNIKVNASASSDKAVYETDLAIRHIVNTISTTETAEIKAGDSWKKSMAIDGIDGTRQLNVELSALEPVNIQSRAKELIAYPHGCVEQTTSKILSQLYLGQYCELSTKESDEVQQNIENGIKRLLQFRTTSGGLAYWPGNKDPHDWGSTYALHTLYLAEKAGYSVPSYQMNTLTSFVKKSASSWRYETRHDNNVDHTAETQAYRLYVLALMGKADVSAMNRLKEKGNNISITARHLLASAYSLNRTTNVAKAIYAISTNISEPESSNYWTFSSSLRAKSINLITLTDMNMQAEALNVRREICKSLTSNKYLSTQETAFAIMAVAQHDKNNSVADDIRASIDFEGQKTIVVNTTRSAYTATTKPTKATSEVKIKNESKGKLYATVSTSSDVLQGNIEAASNKISQQISYFTSDGRSVELSELRQGDNFKAVVKISNISTDNIHNLATSFLLPSGWEVADTRFAKDEANYSSEGGVSYRDIRDDRVLCYIDNLSSGRSVSFTVNISATYNGIFYMPSIETKAMYDASVYARSASGITETK